jgi:osmotically-inducible protein OsmY
MADAFYPVMRANNLKISVAVALFLMAVPVMALQPASHDVTAQLVTAGVAVQDLRAVEVGGIVVLRGRTTDPAAAQQAATIAATLGYARVANLIQVLEVADDARIERTAERRLATYRGLDGTQIAVDSTNGVLRLTGKVSNELQKDMAASLVRNIDGVRGVQVALQR